MTIIIAKCENMCTSQRHMGYGDCGISFDGLDEACDKRAILRKCCNFQKFIQAKPFAFLWNSTELRLISDNAKTT